MKVAQTLLHYFNTTTIIISLPLDRIIKTDPRISCHLICSKFIKKLYKFMFITGLELNAYEIINYEGRRLGQLLFRF
jgi:hypothetical protein